MSVQRPIPIFPNRYCQYAKFDTKIPQFGTPSDVEDFLRASILDRISPHKLGGPFFTSVPSGTSGTARHPESAIGRLLLRYRSRLHGFVW
jgi:hypothetical protein